MFRRLRSTVAALLGRRRFEATMEDEMRFHLEAYTADLVRAGVAPEEAARRARIEFGGVEALKEDCRESRGLRFLDELRQDLRFAGRQLRKSPGFTAAAVISLALGIGANTAVFSLMDAVLFRSLPLGHPEELFFLAHGTAPNRSTSANYPLFERYRSAEGFAGVTTYQYRTFSMRTADGVEQVEGQYVSGNYHAVLQVPMAAGRGFSAEPDRDTGRSPVAVISDAFWSRKYGRSPDAVGRTIDVQGRTVTIVGVTAPAYHGVSAGEHVDLTLPMSMAEPAFFTDREGWISLPIVGRIAPGVSEAQALAGVNVLFRRFWLEPENAWARESPESEARQATLIPAGRGSNGLRRQFAEPLWILMATVGVVLLIACANVANLLLARSAARVKEVAVRLGIGAGRRRLVRQFLTESFLLSTAGGLAGLFVAALATRSVLSLFASGPTQVLLDVPLSTRVLLFTLGASLLTGVLFGIVPALRATRVDLTPSLKAAEAGRMGPQRSPVGKLLLVGQLALSVLVIAAAGLLVRSLHNLRSFDAGFAREQVLMFEAGTRGETFTSDTRKLFYAELLRRLPELPGVAAAAIADRSPVDFSNQLRRLELPGVEPASDAKGVSAVAVTPGYFSAFGIGLVTGRGLTGADRDGAARVVLVNEAMARAYFGERSPLGERIILGGRKDTMAIVGVVRDARHEGLREAAPLSVYTPLAQQGEAFDGSDDFPRNLTAVIRTQGDPRELIRTLQAWMRGVNPDAVVTYIRTMDEQVNAALRSERLLATLSSGFGALALVLAVVGLYGVMSYSVARRAREIGIRMALGATQRAVLGQVLRETLRLAVAGVALGLAAALVLTRTVSALLFGLSPGDPVTLGAVGLLLLVATLLAGLLPARRAARVEPMRVLHAE